MQTRKRAKSVVFGKKHKEKEPEKKDVVEEEVLTEEAEKDTSVKDEAKIPASEEKKETKEKEPEFELSETLPKNEQEEEKVEEKEEEKAAVETPANEFVSDAPLSTTPEMPKNSKEEEAAAPEEHGEEAAEGSELSQPVEATPPAPATPEPSAQQEEDSEAGMPPSAFTIQSNEPSSPAPAATSQPAPEGGKKKFGMYFFVVAFLSFILGLGAMAAASYMGLFGANMAKLPTNVPSILGQKPTPTTFPPTVAPTEKPVDLTAFTIAVLNGSGISGKAAEVKTSLTTAGFKVSSTGNATNNNFTKTEISAKKTVTHDFLTKLESELNKSYTVDTTVAASPDSDTTDVTVTLGQPTSK